MQLQIEAVSSFELISKVRFSVTLYFSFVLGNKYLEIEVLSSKDNVTVTINGKLVIKI